MRQRYTLTKRCIEHCFVFVHFDLDANWLKSNSMCSHPQLFLHVRQESTRGSQSLAGTPGPRAGEVHLAPFPTIQRFLRMWNDYLIVKPFLYSTSHASRCSGVIWLSNTFGLELDTLKVIQRPHVLVVEEDMG